MAYKIFLDDVYSAIALEYGQLVESAACVSLAFLYFCVRFESVGRKRDVRVRNIFVIY